MENAGTEHPNIVENVKDNNDKKDDKEVNNKENKMNDTKAVNKKADVEVRFSIGDEEGEDVFDNIRLERPATKRTQNVRKPRSMSESSYKSGTSETGRGFY